MISKVEVDVREVKVFRDMLEVINEMVSDEGVPLEIRQHYRQQIIGILEGEEEENNNVKLYTSK